MLKTMCWSKRLLCAVLSVLFCLLCAGCSVEGGQNQVDTPTEGTSAPADDGVQIDPNLKTQDKISVTDEMFVHTYGRMDKEDNGLWLEYTATGFSVKFVGTKLNLTYVLEESYPENFTPYITVVVDDESYEEASYYACPKDGIISVEADEGYHTVHVC